MEVDSLITIVLIKDGQTLGYRGQLHCILGIESLWKRT